MRYQGRIATWKDDQGYGFIVQNNGSEQIFVHIKSFSKRGRRPVGNDIVSYEVTTDAKGRKRAENVAFSGARPYWAGSTRTGIALPVLVALFFIFLTATTLVGRLPALVYFLYLLSSLAAYLAYFLDKSAAQAGRGRTPESTLHLLSLVGGWPGALYAQKTLRHKSRKQSFQIVFWATAILNCGALGWWLTPSGAALLHSILAAM